MDFSPQAYPKGQFYRPAEVHSHDEILICKEGTGVIIADGSEHTLSAGEIAIIPAGIHHEDISPEPRLQRVVFLDPMHRKNEPIIQVLPDDNLNFARLTDLALQIEAPRTNRQIAYCDALGTAFVHLLHYVSENARQIDSNRPYGFVHTVDQLIRHNFSDPDFDLFQTIHSTGYSSSYFRRVFLKEFGHSPRTHLIQIRIEHARALMDQFGTTVPIKQIAASCGFRDPFYFSRVFKQITGLAPQQYLLEHAVS